MVANTDRHAHLEGKGRIEMNGRTTLGVSGAGGVTVAAAQFARLQGPDSGVSSQVGFGINRPNIAHRHAERAVLLKGQWDRISYVPINPASLRRGYKFPFSSCLLTERVVAP
jgi:hypothetical protein